MKHPRLAKIAATYGSAGLADKLLRHLQAKGVDPEALTTEDLRYYDELHVMGRQATLDLGQIAGLDASMRVLDVGCGLGGPARTLAETSGCHVIGVDLSCEFIHAAHVLSRRTELSERVAFCHGDALNLSFADQSFDAVCMFHVNMNIADKSTLYAEARRVLKKQGRLALWEICQGDAPGFVFPVPWAENAAFSHLMPGQELLACLRDCGFASIVANDATEKAVQWIRARQKAAGKSAPIKKRADLDWIIPDLRTKRANIAKNLMRGCVRIFQVVAFRH